MPDKELDRFRDLRFVDFERMASDHTLKPHEKVGFPSIFREGYDREIMNDILKKIDWTNSTHIVDIGCGCGELTKLLIEQSSSQSKQLTLVDSKGVLDQLSDQSGLNKVEGRFPENYPRVSKIGLADIVISYSVFHYIFIESNPILFIDKALQLLSPGGQLLLGDIPNVSKRNRFLTSQAGETFHKRLMSTNEKPNVNPFSFESEKIDDGYLVGLINRYRNFGYEAYLLPQLEILPLARSRDDLLFVKPR